LSYSFQILNFKFQINLDRFVLIDGNALMHRAYHAMPPLKTTNGELINAVYGFTSMLLNIFKDLHPEFVACAFDMKAPTFRNLEFVDYKAKRPKMDEELVSQIARIHEVVATMNIPIFEVEGFEADDVIATLQEQAKQHPIQSIIATGDRDALQLVDDQHTLVYCPLKGLSNPILYHEQNVIDKYGFKPSQIADYKALAGDASDNYPGLKGIGPKTATDLLKQFESIDGIYKNIEKIENTRIKNILAENIDFAYKCLKLATVVRDVPITLKLDKCKLKDYDYDKVSKLFAELEFRSLAKRLPGHEEQNQELASLRSGSGIKNHESSTKKIKKEPDKDQLGLF
jgi:DNA polymerase I